MKSGDTHGEPARGGCRLCPRACGVDRAAGEKGVCGAGRLPRVAQAGPHHGEEPCLSGWGGSGTLFFSGCNLHCVFCQNHDISAGPVGEVMDADRLAEEALHLERIGCHNVNFVTPTHHADVVAEAVRIARRRGLAVPVVYNCGGYESPETLAGLEGVVEIYMPDVKFLDPRACRRYLHAEDYGTVVRRALQAMQAQVGDLVIREGLALRGLLVRHLVMPGYTEDALAVMQFLHDAVSPSAFVNVMAQYRPEAEADRFPEIHRRPYREEVEAVRRRARELGLRLCP